MPSPPGQNYDHSYHESFEEAKQELGLAGQSFDYFWQDIAQVFDEDPFNVYAKEIPTEPGFWVYPTAPAHPDFLSCGVIFSVDKGPGVKRIHYYGLLPCPADWTYVPLGF